MRRIRPTAPAIAALARRLDKRLAIAAAIGAPVTRISITSGARVSS